MARVWMYHPEKGAKCFNSPEDVPEGWFDAPGKAKAVTPDPAPEIPAFTKREEA
jgi:hypothetical protein